MRHTAPWEILVSIQIYEKVTFTYIFIAVRAPISFLLLDFYIIYCLSWILYFFFFLVRETILQTCLGRHARLDPNKTHTLLDTYCLFSDKNINMVSNFYFYCFKMSEFLRSEDSLSCEKLLYLILHQRYLIIHLLFIILFFCHFLSIGT